MTVPPQEREERYAFLCREIERLIERHKAMPTDDLKARVGAQITEYVHELDEMDQDSRREREVGEARSGDSWPFPPTPGTYQALGAGIVCLILGVIFDISLVTLGGVVVLLVTVSSLTRNRSARTGSTEPKRWDWKP